MKSLRRIGSLFLAAVTLAYTGGFLPAAFAQAPAPVPALPDTERRTSYNLTGSTCACSVGFALYGDSTDYQNWVEVYLNGVRVNYNDSLKGWTITSPTGPLASIPRPVTDAVLTFSTAQTGTVQIVGARRPRRTMLFQENRGVAARDLNQGFNDIFSQNRETWDKINDVTGRGLFSQPGNTVGPLPAPSTCVANYLGFDATGLNPVCLSTTTGVANFNSPPPIGNVIPNTGAFTTLSASSTVSGPGFISLFASPPPLGSIAQNTVGASTLNIGAQGMVGDGLTNNNTTFQNALTAVANGGDIQLPCGVYKLTTSFSVSLAAGQHIRLSGSGSDCTELYFSGTTAGVTITYGSQYSSVEIRDLTFTTDDSTGVNTALTLSEATATVAPAANKLVNLTFRGHDGYFISDYWGTAISEVGVSDITIDNLYVAGLNTPHGVALSLSSSSAADFSAQITVTNSYFYGNTTSIIYGAFVQALYLTNTSFNNATTGISVPASETGLDVLQISNCVLFTNNSIVVGSPLPNIQIVNSSFIIPANGTGIKFTAPATQFILTGNAIGGANTTNDVGVVFNAAGGNNNIIANNVFVSLQFAIAINAAQPLLITGNKFSNLGNPVVALQTSVVAYGNTPEVPYGIATLPSCTSAIWGIKAVVTDGVASPTYHGAVSTTGATWQPVWCSGTSSSWVYD